MSKVTKSAFTLMIATLIAKILGFGRELVLASTYGASIYSDAFLISSNIPIVIFSIIGAAISNTFIPIYFDIYNKNGKKNANNFVNNILNIVIIICMIIFLFGYIYTDKLVLLFAIGFEGEVLDLTINFTKVIMVGVIFLGISNIMTAYLQANNKFNVIGLITIPYNLIIIVSIVISIRYGANIMIWGALLGILGQCLIQLPYVIRSGMKYKLTLDLKDKYIRNMVTLIIPVCIGVAVNQVNIVIDKNLASRLIQGSISALNYANKLTGFIMGIFIISITSVIYPILSSASSSNNIKEVKEITIKSINSVILLILPITIGAIIFSRDIVEILFKRGAFDTNAVEMTSIALVFYSIGLLGMALRDILGKVFYSLQDTKTPMINGIIAVFFNIVFNIILVKKMGHGGLALATSISSIICIILLFISLNKKIGDIGYKNIVKTFIQSTLASIIMGVFSIIIYNILSDSLHKVVSLAITIVLGAVVYTITILNLKNEEIVYIYKILKTKREKNGKKKSSDSIWN